MSETPVHETPIPGFDLKAQSIEDGCWKILARIGIWYKCIQPEKSTEDFTREFIVPMTEAKPGVPIEITFAAYKSSKHSEQVLRGLITMILQGCSYCFAAINADEEGKQTEAWSHIGNAMFCLGRLEGALLLEPAVKHVIKTQSAKGAKARDAKYEEARILARKLAMAGDYADAAKAARAIKDRVVAKAAESGASMTATRAERTIYDWLHGLTFGSKR
jgi:hypothetical protein